jgi:gamma-glutamyl:cysteine ligase YbdK (ATP-grasp superfamily)
MSSALPAPLPARLRLFEGYGIELEYMIVDRETLDVRPIADQLLRAASGGSEWVADVEQGDVGWSNELALHVIELKTSAPARSLEGLPQAFGTSLQRANALLAPLGARLLPTAMHPWMDPLREMRLWPHDSSPIYQAFDRIFDCRGHGWANLQAMHLNLPFADDREFDALHSAIRLVLPLLPALSAASPFAEGRATGLVDTRLEVYRQNSARVPAMAGRIVPEAVSTRVQYEEQILGAIYRALEPYDPEGVLRYEFANARGAIARFDRFAIEIRVLDVQETPRADLAIAALTSRLLEALVAGRWTTLAEQRAQPLEPLADLFLACIREGERTPVRDASLLRHLGLRDRDASAGEVWRHLVDELRFPPDDPWRPALDVLLDEGPLARRILRATGPSPAPGRLREVYGELARCLDEGRLFRP